MLKRNLALLLLAALLLTACGNTGAGETDAAAENDTVLETVETEPEEALEIAVKDYEGYNVNIALAGNWAYTDFIAEELTGESVNDAVYNTNQSVAELLNVTFTVDNRSGKASGGQGEGFKLVDNMVMAGTNDYEFMDIGCYDVCTLAYNGRILDLNAVPNIDLSKSWWDPKANEHLSIRDKMFFSTGDIGILDNDCTYCILFNKQVVTDYGLDDPYELVANNRWTYDKMYEMADTVDGDTNGDGENNIEDNYGFIIWQDSVIGMLHSSGGRCGTIGDDGSIKLTLNTEQNIDVLTRWLSMNTEPIAFFLGGATDDEVHGIFTENRGLFYTRYLRAASWFRDMETDFGILPYPKWDVFQRDFCNTMHAYGTSYICVPVTAQDPARAGAVIEALAYYGQKLITPAYYETTLKGKYFRDEESAAMLDIIFSSRFFDIGMYYQIGGYNERLIQMMQQGNTDFVSMYTKNEQAALKKLDQINKAYAAME